MSDLSSEPNFDQLIQHHEMGQAYIAITEAMGPSPQLIAFVNYTNALDDDKFGLESFNIMDQHQQILGEIANDQSLSIACESLTGGLAKYRKWLLGAGAVGVFLVGFGPLTVTLIAAGAAGIVLKHKDGEVPSTARYAELVKSFGHAVRAESLFTNAIPSTLDEKAWASFREDYVGGDLFEADENVGEARWNEKEGNVAFDKSGWTIDSFKNATKWLVDNEKKVKELEAKQAAKIDKVEKLLASDAVKGSKVMKDISMMLKVAHRSTHDSAKILNDVQGVLAKVAKHFEPKPKD